MIQSQNNKLKETAEWLVALGCEDLTTYEPFDKRVSTESLIQSLSNDKKEPKENQDNPKKDVAPHKISASMGSISVQNAEESAAKAKNLDELRRSLEEFEGCPLKQTATHLVFGEGNPESGIMLVGEAPDGDEDKQGRPFVGVSGQLLDKMLFHIGLKSRDSFYLTNVINWRPPGNRQPTDSEIAMMMPFVKKHIELVNPKILLLVGGVSAKALMNENKGITKLRGKWVDYYINKEQNPIPSRALLHPAYLLRQPTQKKLAWLDVLTVKSKLVDLGYY